MAVNKIEAIKAAKHPLDVLDDIYKYAQTGWESIPEDDWERMKWYGVFFRRTTPGFFMMRLRIPNGILTSQQVRTIAGIIQEFGRDKADITTREAIQLRWIEIANVPEIFRRLQAAGLTSQQSGMDSMRNVVGCPIAGIDPHEALDASSIAKSIQSVFVGFRELADLPRKINFAVTGCLDDCIHAQAHDVSFVPAQVETEQGVLTGFNVLVGGALSGRDPKFAEPLDAFVLPAEVPSLSRAILTTFRDFGPRDARTRSRLKVLLADWGIERFRAELEERFGLPLRRAGRTLSSHEHVDHIGVHPQRQAGLHYVGMCVPVGRITGTGLQQLADLADSYGAGEVRLTPDQNVILPHVPATKLDALLAEPLLQAWSPTPGHALRGAVSCTGHDYCHFALVDTKDITLGLARELDARQAFDGPVRIHMSGCPNACGMHGFADVSLLGVKVRVEGEIIEAVDVGVGGGLGETPRLAQDVASAVPVPALAQLVQEQWAAYSAQRVEAALDSALAATEVAN